MEVIAQFSVALEVPEKFEAVKYTKTLELLRELSAYIEKRGYDFKGDDSLLEYIFDERGNILVECI